MNKKSFFTLKKSFIGFFLVLLVLGVLVEVAVRNLNKSNEEVDAASESRFTSYQLAEEVIANSRNLTRYVRLYTATGRAEYENNYWNIVNVRAGKKPRADGRQIAQDDLLREAGFTKEEFELLGEAGKLSDQLVGIEDRAMHLVKGLYPDANGKYTVKGAPDMDKANEMVNSTAYQAELDRISQPVDKFLTMMQERTRNAQKKAQDAVVMAELMATIMLLAMIVVSMPVLIWLFRLISREVNRALGAAEKLAKGDLTVALEVDRDDELGKLMEAINGIGAGLDGVVSGVRTGVETINVAAKEIATGNADLSARTESQASSLEETASSMEELTSTVRQNADNARQANQLVTKASEMAVKGGEVVGNVVTTMASIKESSAKIADIISVIDGIAFQTNILALNAAVEAARAGEQGRGFAVVASEVRNLAQRSASAAKEITDLINDSGTKVDAGSKLVDEAGATMTEIVTSVKHVTDIMSEISSASAEQSQGIAKVGDAVTQIDSITQHNAALVEEAAAAAESLLEQAGELTQMVKIFKTKSGSGARAAKRTNVEPTTSAKAAAAPVKPKETAPKLTPAKKVAPPQAPAEDAAEPAKPESRKMIGGPKDGKAPDGDNDNINNWEQF